MNKANARELNNTHRKDMFLVLDTETLGWSPERPDLNQKVFDLGYKIIDKDNKEYSKGSFLVSEYYWQIIKSHAFYQDKLNYYKKYVKTGYSKVASYSEIIELLEHEIEVYDVDYLVAYNLGFDIRVLRKTYHALTGSDRLIFDNLVHFDLYHVACQTILNTPKYKKWASDNYYKHLNLETFNFKTGAESCYSYLINEPDYIEEHTALSDVEIECEILVRAIKTTKKYSHEINSQSWRIVNSNTEKNIYYFKRANPDKSEIVEQYRQAKKEKEKNRKMKVGKAAQ